VIGLPVGNATAALERDWQVAAYYVLRSADLPPFETAVQYLLAADGLYKRSCCPHFEARVRLMRWPRPLPGLAAVREGVTLHVPRLPGAWLGWALEAARRACDTRPREWLLQVVVRNGCICLDTPQQHATATTLQFAQAPGSVLCDLHSHHDMPARFSTLDDRDEGGLRFYGVMGHIFSRPALRLRVGVYGHWLPVAATALFETAGPFSPAGGTRDYVDATATGSGYPVNRG
jgi:PRTRC genetic system protein A